MKLANINQAPVRFFRWLGVNDVSVDLAFSPQDIEACAPVPSGPGYEVESYQGLLRPEQALPVHQLALEYPQAGRTVQIAPGAKIEKPIQLERAAQPGESLLDVVEIVAGDDCEATVYLTSREEVPGQSARLGLIQVRLGKNSRLKIVRTLLLSHSVEHFGVQQAENAHLDVVAVDFARHTNVVDYHCRLAGEGSTHQLSTAYMGCGQDVLDFNFLVDIQGKAAQAAIQTRGILQDQAKKTMKSTLSFHRGAKASKGAESEYVMLISDDVTNNSIPLLLCQEDDVAGEHAAGVGRIDENTLFYLLSRGFTPQQAKNILVSGYLTPVLDQLGDEALYQEIQAELACRMVRL